MNVKNYSEPVHMARTHELARETQPYERVPNILRFSITFSLHVFTLKYAMEGV